MPRVRTQASSGPTLAEALAEREERRRARVKASFSEFVKEFWDQVVPEAPLVWMPHIEAICDHLQAVSEGRIKELLVNVPPGSGKSVIVSVLWTAWEWLWNPGLQVQYASYSSGLSERDSLRTRELVESEEYQALVDGAWALKGIPYHLDEFWTTAGGWRRTTTIKGVGTGFRGHRTVVDDPHNVSERATEAEYLGVASWWDHRMSNRFHDLDTAQMVIIMQRVHELDLSGHCLAQGTYEHLCLPAEYDPDLHCTTSIGFSDWRTEPGELLNPVYMGRETLERQRIKMGERQYAGQYQQRPAPAGGNLVIDAYLHYYRALPTPLAGDWLLSWDTKATASKSQRASYVVGQCWFRPKALKGRIYLVDQVRFKGGIIPTMQALRAMSAKWQAATTKLVENKATGPAVVEMLCAQIPGIIPIDPHGDKASRFDASLPLWEAGNIMLPHPDIAPWVVQYVAEITTFPAAANDDQADATSQALDWFRLHGAVSIEYEPVGRSAYGGRSGW